MLDRLIGFLDKSDIISESQHDFRKAKSTTSALNWLDFYGTVLDGIENKKSILGIFCDLRKDLDCVQYGKHLEKLQKFGM